MSLPWPSPVESTKQMLLLHADIAETLGLAPVLAPFDPETCAWKGQWQVEWKGWTLLLTVYRIDSTMPPVIDQLLATWFSDTVPGQLCRAHDAEIWTAVREWLPRWKAMPDPATVP